MSIENVKRDNMREKKDKEYYILLLIIILSEHCFSLIDIHAINISGVLSYDDLALVLYMAFCGHVLLKYKHLRMKKYRFKFASILTLVLVIVSSCVGNNLYNQGVILGIRGQRLFLIVFFSYFPMSKYICADRKNRERLKSVLYSATWIGLSVYIIQYILRDVYIFTYADVSIRYGGVRFLFESCILSVMYFVALGDLLKGKDVKKNTALIILLLIYNMFIIRTRMLVIATVASSIFILFLWKKSIVLKLSMFFGGTVIFCGLLFTPMMSNYLTVFDSNVLSTDGSYQLRQDGKEYYRKKLTKSPITGRGFINSLNPKAVEEAGINKKYMLNDNGLMGFRFMYGYIGVAWIAIMFTYIYFYSWLAYRRKSNYTSLAYIVFLTIIMSNMINFYWGWTPLIFTIMLGFLESDFVEFTSN